MPDNNPRARRQSQRARDAQKNRVNKLSRTRGPHQSATTSAVASRAVNGHPSHQPSGSRDPQTLPMTSSDETEAPNIQVMSYPGVGVIDSQAPARPGGPISPSSAPPAPSTQLPAGTTQNSPLPLPHASPAPPPPGVDPTLLACCLQAAITLQSAGQTGPILGALTPQNQIPDTRPRVSFQDTDRSKCYTISLSLSAKFPEVDTRIIEHIWGGKFQGKDLYKLAVDQAVSIGSFYVPHETKIIRDTILGVEVYGKIVGALSSPARELELKSAFSQYRINLWNKFMLHTPESVKRYNEAMINRNVRTGQDIPDVWRNDDDNLRKACLILRGRAPPFSGSSISSDIADEAYDNENWPDDAA